MSHLEKRANRYYAVLTVPEDVRSTIGRLRYVQSTGTEDRAEAKLRAAILVAGWKSEIAKARGKRPDPKATFWENLRRDYIEAQGNGDEAVQFAIEAAAEVAAEKVSNPAEAAKLYTFATNQMGTLLAPLVEGWKGSMRRLAQKTIDQRHRDVKRMADHFVSVEALKPKQVKEWTDKLIKEGATVATMERIFDGCRSFWRYLQDELVVPVEAADPFAGSFRLARNRATRNTVDRQSFTSEDLAKVYDAARSKGDTALADLIALGAYTGARIEELCSLTVETSKDGVFSIVDSKTEAGIRQVPVHPKLRALVKRLQEASIDGYLIPSTAAGQYGVRSDPLSKRFGYLKTKLGFGPGHVFHSIRKTTATLLEQAGVPEGIAADILGHEKKTLSYGLYSTGSSLKDKLNAITKVCYPSSLDRPE